MLEILATAALLTYHYPTASAKPSRQAVNHPEKPAMKPSGWG